METSNLGTGFKVTVKILGLCASPRRGATEAVLRKALEAAKGFGCAIETEYVSLSNKRIASCCDCRFCIENQMWCQVKDDMQEIFDLIIDADALLVASPVYVMSATPHLYALCSRMRPAIHVYPELFREKFISVIAVGGKRNGGQEITISNIHNLFMARGMNVVSNESGYYAGAHIWSKDGDAEAVLQDLSGIDSAEKLVRKLTEITYVHKLGRMASTLLA
ncbi:MAG: flavodoxin family protein [Saccharofermentanales bacterium]